MKVSRDMNAAPNDGTVVLVWDSRTKKWMKGHSYPNRGWFIHEPCGIVFLTAWCHLPDPVED